MNCLCSISSGSLFYLLTSEIMMAPEWAICNLGCCGHWRFPICFNSTEIGGPRDSV